MNEKLFDDTVEKATEKHINQLEVYSSPIKTYELSPMQATFIEKDLNSNNYDDHMGFLLVPVRTSEQILYKSSMVEESKHFAQEQENLLLQFYKSMQSVKKTLNPEQFHCFLTLQQLRRHPLGKYFMSMPNPIYLKLYDYKKIVGNFLDIRTIASRILKRFYKSKQEFQLDMVAMIHKYRNYFVFDKEMLDISIKFEILFWDIYKNEEKIHKDAMDTFKYLKQRCKAARNFNRKQKEKISVEKKKELVVFFNSLQANTKRKILFALQVGPLKGMRMQKDQPINLSKMKDKFFVELEEVLKEEQKKMSRTNNKKERKRKEKMEKQMKEGVINDQNEIYYSDVDQDEQNNGKQALQDVLDLINMEEAAFGSDDD